MKYKNLRELFPSPEELLNLEPEDIAPLLLQYLNQGASRNLNLHNFVLPGGDLSQYAGNRYDDVAHAVAEAWALLESEILLASEPRGSSGDWVFITRRGESLQSRTDFDAYFKGNLLPAKSLEPVLATRVRPLFLRGDYDTAVFRAFKEVEIRARAAAKLPDTLIGVDLMRKAFHPENGPLTDTTRASAERQATSDLFAGAIGLFKNPSSHRDVAFSPEEAADLIRLANYLILWIDHLCARQL